MKARSWCICFVSIVVTLAILLMLIAYIIDPMNLYSWHEIRFMNSGVNFNPGIIRNYDADYYVIGSSMIQNTDMDQVRAAGYNRPVKLEKGGMTVNEELMILRLIASCGQNTPILLSIDLSSLIQAEEIVPSSDVFNEELYSYSTFDDWRYLLGYKTWWRYIPLTVVMELLNSIGILPSMFESVLDIDQIGRWWESAETQFGKEHLIAQYQTGAGGTSSIPDNITRQEVFSKVDDFVEQLSAYTANIESVTIGFPPYSALYWHTQKVNGDMSLLLDTKAYLQTKLLEMGNVQIVDMQDHPLITDLDHYKDQTHYDLILQHDYTESFLSEGGNVHSVEEIDDKRIQLEERIISFERENASWL